MGDLQHAEDQQGEGNHTKPPSPPAINEEAEEGVEEGSRSPPPPPDLPPTSTVAPEMEEAEKEEKGTEEEEKEVNRASVVATSSKTTSTAPTIPASRPHNKPKAVAPPPHKAASTSTSAKHNKKNGDKPRRPLSAYNYFFREQRVDMLQERDEKLRVAQADGTKPEDNGEYGFFGTMAKVIAKRWKEIAPEALQGYKKKAEIDSKRYRMEMEDYNKRKSLLPKKPSESSSPKKKKGLKKLLKGSLKKEKEVSKAVNSHKLSLKGPSGASVSSLPLAAPKELSPSLLSMPTPMMSRFAQAPAMASELGLGGMGATGFSRALLQQQQLPPQYQQQYLGQLDLETQIALLNHQQQQQQQQLQFQQQQQRSLDSMSLFPQSSRQALYGVQPQYVVAAAPQMQLQPQYYFEAAPVQQQPSPQQQQLNDLSMSGGGARYEAYQLQQQQDQQQQQQQENQMLLRQQLLAGGGGPAPAATAQTLQDPAYANILLQLRLQEEERLRHQAAAMGLSGGAGGGGRW